jgi:hypothetical protein
MDKIIIEENDIKLKNGIWKEIKYDEGEIIHTRYDEEFNCFVIIRFTN